MDAITNSHKQGVNYTLTQNHLNDKSLDAFGEDQSLIQLVHQILKQAIEKKASDIHFEPSIEHYRIRFRLDGLLKNITQFPPSIASRITARIKILANLDISERRIPQDGHFKIEISLKKMIDFRISTCPTIHGEKMVIRILDTLTIQPNLDALLLTRQQKQLVLKALYRPQGMILISGPTGSGKTTTLYAALNTLNTGEKNLLSIEDPVEMDMPGINQVNINPKIGLTFSNTLRTFLRQDPDVIMIGEIRDLDTATMAIQAAQTGHLVLSTLHANSAVETLQRLMNLGIPVFNLAHSISLIIAQRLVRRSCVQCQTQGCEHCFNGYQGRIAVFEILPISKAIANMMMDGHSITALQQQAEQEGMLTLHQQGLRNVQLGLTTPEELARVIEL